MGGHWNHRLSLSRSLLKHWDSSMLHYHLWGLNTTPVSLPTVQKNDQSVRKEDMGRPVFPRWPMVWSKNKFFIEFERETWTQGLFLDFPLPSLSLSVGFDSNKKTKMAADSVQVGKVDNCCEKCANFVLFFNGVPPLDSVKRSFRFYCSLSRCIYNRSDDWCVLIAKEFFWQIPKYCLWELSMDRGLGNNYPNIPPPNVVI